MSDAARFLDGVVPILLVAAKYTHHHLCATLDVLFQGLSVGLGAVIGQLNPAKGTQYITGESITRATLHLKQEGWSKP